MCCINHLVRDALRSPRERPRYGYVAPQYGQAKRVAWDFLKHYTDVIPGRQWNEAELRCDLPNGSRIQLYGADNPDSLRGVYLDGVVLDEYAQMKPSVWGEVIRPALSDRQGWAIFIGTPKGKNGFWELYRRAQPSAGADYFGDDWHAMMFRASETGILPEGELQAATRQMEPNEFAQEFECSFEAAILGAYYGEQMQRATDDRRICAFPHEPHAPVHTAWDLGVGDSTAIWFLQEVGREVHAIDYYEASGVGLDHYVGMLQSKGYVYGQHVLPHDVRVRELGTGKSRLEVLQALGLTVTVAPQLKVDDGIHQVRSLLSRMWMHAERCQRGIEALRQYRREWDERGGLFRARPCHDWTSHAADALRYYAVSAPLNYDTAGDDYQWGTGAASVVGGWMGA